MMQWLAIALGGSAGAMLRFWVANGIYGLLGRGFPHATLFINVSGSFLMGILTELMLNRFAVAAEYRAAILVGFLGAYTTFSTFALETLYLFEAGSLLKAFLNILLSVVLCLTACWIGLIWGRNLFGDGLPSPLSPSINCLQLLSGFGGILCMAMLITLGLQSLNTPPVVKAAVFILLLSVIVMAASLWQVFKLEPSTFDFQTLLGIFIINTLLAATTIGSGAWIGISLWQLKQSP